MPVRSEGALISWLVALGTAALLSLVSLMLLAPGSTDEAPWVRASYDATYHLAPEPGSPAADSPVVLVYLDRESYEREHRKPDELWDRSLHAALVDRLTQAGARAVVFDIVFAEGGNDAAADQELARAIRRNGRTILAAELNDWRRETGGNGNVQARAPVLPFEPFRAAAAGWGLASLRVDRDFTVRRYFPGYSTAQLPSLTWATAQFLKLPIAQSGPESPSWLRYVGPPLAAVPHVSFSSALHPSEVPDDFFRDRIVLIGARPIVGAFLERRDEYRNPWPVPSRGSSFMPAVEVHATQMLNLVRGDGLRRWSLPVEACVLLAAAAMGAGLLLNLRPLGAAVAAVGVEVGVLGAVAIAFRDGGWFPWLIVAVVQIPGALAGSVVFRSLEWYRQRRRFEATRRANEAKIREQAALLDKAQDAILVRRLTGEFAYVNPAAEELFGWTAAEWFEGKAAGSVLGGAGGPWASAEEHTRAKGEWLGELELTSRTGGTRLVQSRWTLIRDEQSNPQAYLIINTDITEKKRLEAQVLRTQRMETIGNLAGGMAHDLNSALAPVLMGIQLLRREVTDPESQRLLGVMETNTHRGAEMVRQVLLFSRGQVDERQLLDVGMLLREVERILQHSLPKSIRIGVLAPRDLWPVFANRTQLHQVLLNLCLNARDAMPQGGELSLSADNVLLDEAEVAELPHGRAGHYVLLLVGDTGEGIPADLVPRLFEPFFTTKEAGKGTGLGLATVARIVAMHGGFCHVRSEVGVGSTFEVYLPRSVPEASPAQIAVSELPRGRGEAILLVEDDRALGELLGQALREQGYRTLPAAQVAEAESLAKAHSAEIQLLILDVGSLEGAMESKLEPLVALLPGRPVLILSGTPLSPEQPRTRVMAKPVTMPGLLREVAQLLSPSTMESGASGPRPGAPEG